MANNSSTTDKRSWTSLSIYNVPPAYTLQNAAMARTLKSRIGNIEPSSRKFRRRPSGNKRATTRSQGRLRSTVSASFASPTTTVAGYFSWAQMSRKTHPSSSRRQSASASRCSSWTGSFVATSKKPRGAVAVAAAARARTPRCSRAASAASTWVLPERAPGIPVDRVHTKKLGFPLIAHS